MPDSGVQNPKNRWRHPELDQLPPKPTRVLVADDELLQGLDVVSRLGTMGYVAVGPCTTAAEAVRLARASRPDIAILDVGMPDGDGIDAAETIIEELLIPVIILSAYTDAETVERAKNAGVFAYLVKPASEQQLHAAIEVAWGRYQRYVSELVAGDEARQRLDERKVIERAKWLLVNGTGITEERAMRLIEEYARDHRERLVDVAKRVIQSHRATPPTQPPW